MPIQKRALALLVGVGLMIAGCASGAKISETAIAQQPPVKGQSRIFVYRTGLLGAAIQPVVAVDGQPAGDCRPNGAFFVDVKPGKHEVSATTEVTRTLALETTGNQTSYVECSIGIGFFVGRPELTLVAPEKGAASIQPLAFTGKH